MIIIFYTSFLFLFFNTLRMIIASVDATIDDSNNYNKVYGQSVLDGILGDDLK